MFVNKRFIMLIASAMVIALAGCQGPDTEATRTPEKSLLPTPSTSATSTPSPTPIPSPSPKPSPTPSVSPKPALPKPSPSPTPDIAQIKRQLVSDVQDLYDAVHNFTGGEYRFYGPTPEQKGKVTWQNAHHIEFSFGGRLYFYSLSADRVDSAQKHIEKSYSMTTGQSANVTDEALIQGVVSELQQAITDFNFQTLLSTLAQAGQVDSVKKKDDPVWFQRTFSEEEVNYAVKSITASHEKYRKSLGEIVSKVNYIMSYTRRVATPTPTPSRTAALN